ncbi:MAG: hypothetical protein WCJ02_13225 [bacterium]
MNGRCTVALALLEAELEPVSACGLRIPAITLILGEVVFDHTVLSVDVRKNLGASS